MSRPPILFPLFASIETVPGVGPRTAKAMANLDITRPRDLIFTLPYGGHDRSLKPSIKGLGAGDIATVEVTVGVHQHPRQKGRPYRVVVADSWTTFHVVFFNNDPRWIQSQLPTGQKRVISGRLEFYDGIAQIIHPDHMLRPDEIDHLPKFEPVWPLSAGLTQKLMLKAVTSSLTRVPELPEWADGALVARENWPAFHEAIAKAQRPDSVSDLSPETPARRRLAYDELFAHQVTLALARTQARRGKGRESHGTGTLQAKVLAGLPYKPTNAQTRAISEIAGDLASPLKMNRLLQGDVGSGKTLVALTALLIAVEAGGQGVMMAPTEILARQHYDGLKPLAELAGIRLELLTGRDNGRERDAKLAALANGEIQIMTGTHALFQKDVFFHDLRLAVVDEQHRFGVTQRMELGAKGEAVDVLVMTATPIPRSLALASYGDMDISVLDEKPPGRIPVKTALISAERIDDVVAHLRKAVAEGRQAYWVCPLVQESETREQTAAEDRFQRLRAALGEGVVGLVHGQLPPAEKDRAMADFVSGKTRVLVATTVIEVGVNVPNASIMVIEGAETFGLAQLHQLRGRVGRGSESSTCLMIWGNLSETGQRRLEVMRETEDGFRIAEEDLAMRGAGDLIGTAQSGVPKFRIADLERQTALMELAQSDARKLLVDDPLLESPRGQAVRTLLHLMDQDRAFRLLSVG
jgi:ATP-dependent DNA helicase RecG